MDGVKVPDLPGGTVTFLFSDIEGSTRLWESQPVLMASALAAHDQIVRDQVAAAGGTVFKHTGDGFAAVFVRVSEALGVAARITRELADRDWGPCPIRVRMGIHAGEAQPRDGDYFGVTVTRAARVMDAGSGGQVVVTDTAAGLASHLVPEGANLVDCGLHRLKDLGEPVHLWQLLVGGVDDHRALRTLESTPNNLPVRLSSFVGRRREIAEVRRALEQARLVTLTGIGGVGKTRLAMQVAADLLGGYEDGVWLVELSSLSEPELVPQTVVMALKIPTLDQPPMEALLAHLAHRRALIVLDNCEHLVDAAAKLVESVLAVTRGVDVLATSREALAVNGETQWRVSPLGIGSESDEAVELFVDRATSVLPGFELTAENRGSVETICRHLDGIPLAIELATARLTMLDAAQIADHLDDRFRLLTGGSRTAAERQRTLRAMMDWSHDLLTASERQLLRRLSVFSDGFDLEAVEAVCAADWISVFDVLDLLGRLVDVSLVVFEREPTPRYHLLETVREYADVKLQEAGEAAETHRRHAEHFDRVASRIEALVDSNHTPEGMRLGEVELANLRAAMAWSYDAGWPELGLSIAVHLWAYFFRLVSQGEALGWLRTGVDLVPAEASVLYVRCAVARADGGRQPWRARHRPGAASPGRGAARRGARPGDGGRPEQRLGQCGHHERSPRLAGPLRRRHRPLPRRGEHSLDEPAVQPPLRGDGHRGSLRPRGAHRPHAPGRARRARASTPVRRAGGLVPGRRWTAGGRLGGARRRDQSPRADDGGVVPLGHRGGAQAARPPGRVRGGPRRGEAGLRDRGGDRLAGLLDHVRAGRPRARSPRRRDREVGPGGAVCGRR